MLKSLLRSNDLISLLDYINNGNALLSDIDLYLLHQYVVRTQEMGYPSGIYKT